MFFTLPGVESNLAFKVWTENFLGYMLWWILKEFSLESDSSK